MSCPGTRLDYTPQPGTEAPCVFDLLRWPLVAAGFRRGEALQKEMRAIDCRTAGALDDVVLEQRALPSGRHGPRLLEDSLEHIRDLKDGAIVESSGVCAIAGQRGRLDQLRDRPVDLFKAPQHRADFPLEYPIGVVALLGKSPDVAFDDHRKPHGQGFANASGTWLADEKISQLHVVVHPVREPLDEARQARLLRAQSVHKFIISPANEDQLKLEGRSIQTFGDFEHGL